MFRLPAEFRPPTRSVEVSPRGQPARGLDEKETTVDPKLEEATGRVKEAAGALTGDDDLKAEGQADQAEAKAREAVDDAADKAKDAVAGAAKAAEGVIDSVKDKLS
jgi:uncharacterized protein YjbJ (UPF0337 family)